jgi:hypothetical protein
MMVLNLALAREAESRKHCQVLEQEMQICNTCEENIGIHKEVGARTTFFSTDISNYVACLLRFIREFISVCNS